jgi:hypothetical protein
MGGEHATGDANMDVGIWCRRVELQDRRGV